MHTILKQVTSPPGETSWCKFQADIANGTNKYVEKTGLPTYLRDKLLPIFQDLGSRDLLSKCMHGSTQNNNESLNGFVWTKCPKEIFVERYVLEIGVCSAVLNFNSGLAGIINVLQDVGVLIRHFTKIFCDKKECLCKENGQ